MASGQGALPGDRWQVSPSAFVGWVQVRVGGAQTHGRAMLTFAQAEELAVSLVEEVRQSRRRDGEGAPRGASEIETFGRAAASVWPDGRVHLDFGGISAVMEPDEACRFSGELYEVGRAAMSQRHGTSEASSAPRGALGGVKLADLDNETA